MSVDHLERGAKDAGRLADAAVQAAVADARTLASEMMKGTAAVPDEARKVTEQLETQIRRLGADVAAKTKMRS